MPFEVLGLGRAVAASRHSWRVFMVAGGRRHYCRTRESRSVPVPRRRRALPALDAQALTDKSPPSEPLAYHLHLFTSSVYMHDVFHEI